MKYTSSEAELVEQYVDALLTNPDAMPPAGIDVETAHLIRALVVTRRRSSPGDQVKDRVWRQVLFAIHATPEADFIPEAVLSPTRSNFRPKLDQHPINLRTPRRPNHHASRMVMLVATLCAVIFFTGLFMKTAELSTLSNTALDSEFSYQVMLTPVNAILDPGELDRLEQEPLQEALLILDHGVVTNPAYGEVTFGTYIVTFAR